MNLQDIEFELHTHTIQSGHAYGTFTEMVKEAKDKGLKAIGITDHGPALPDAPYYFYFQNLKVLPRNLFGIDVLVGAELNCIDYKGTLDLDEERIKNLDIRLVGLHTPAYKIGNEEENTSAYLNLCKNPQIDCIVHPDDSNIPVDYEKLVKCAKEHDVLLEVNNNSLRAIWKKNVRENLIIMLNLCKKYDNKVVLASDAHYMSDIKNLQNCIDICKEVGIKSDNIVNFQYSQFKEFINSKRKNERGL
ncbi:MAG: phosphatase [Eubacteriales bacterium]|nr:phosphatase [Eubacteriales bacterium]